MASPVERRRCAVVLFPTHACLLGLVGNALGFVDSQLVTVYAHAKRRHEFRITHGQRKAQTYAELVYLVLLYSLQLVGNEVQVGYGQIRMCLTRLVLCRYFSTGW